MIYLRFKMVDGPKMFHLFIAVFFMKISIFYCSGVPALVWSPTRSFVGLPEVYSGHTVKHEDFVSKYLDPITRPGNELIVLFVQNKLGLDDFVRYADIYSIDGKGGAFPHVKAFLDENFSLQMPSVDFSAETISRLQRKFPENVVELAAPYDVKNVVSASTKLLIVRLPDIHVADEKSSFLKNDELIATVIAGLHGREYIAIYTAVSHQQGDEGVLRFHGRHLMAAGNTSSLTVVNSTNQFLLYAKGFQLNTYTMQKKSRQPYKNVPLGALIDHTLDFSNSSVKLTLTYTPPNSNLTKLTLSYGFGRASKSSDWFVTDASVDYTGTLPGDTPSSAPGQSVELNVGRAYNGLSTIWAPLAMSYHCSVRGLMKQKDVNVSDDEVTIALEYDKIQVQPFWVKGDSFSQAYDCVPFFTGIIWTGIVSVAILLFILYFGLYMISDIKVMKNFDDPKDKQLITHTGD